MLLAMTVYLDAIMYSNVFVYVLMCIKVFGILSVGSVGDQG